MQGVTFPSPSTFHILPHYDICLPPTPLSPTQRPIRMYKNIPQYENIKYEQWGVEQGGGRKLEGVQRIMRLLKYNTTCKKEEVCMIPRVEPPLYTNKTIFLGLSFDHGRREGLILKN